MSIGSRKTYLRPVRAVIFDWAGTLADYGCMAPAAVFIDLFTQHGVPITMAQAREPMGSPKRDHIASIAAMSEVASKWERLHGSPIDDSVIDALYAEFIPMQLACLAEHGRLIPGALETAQILRARGLKIGTTTGYNAEMLEIVLREAERQGFKAESNISASDVPKGRPAPWMALKAACELDVYPPESIVKVGDTVPDVEEGLNAGMWAVAVVRTGNEIGLTQQEVEALSESEYRRLAQKAYERLHEAGAHFVVESVKEVPDVVQEVERRLARGERP